MGSQQNYPFYTDESRIHPNLSAYQQPAAGGAAGQKNGRGPSYTSNPAHANALG